MENKPEFIMLVGLPGTGKSTYAKAKMEDKEYVVLSTDDIIETIGNKYGLSYNQMFDDITYSFAEKIMRKIAINALNNGKNVIWDQTNLTIKSRAKKLALVPDSYTKICAVFKIPANLQEVLKHREEKEGKFIPPNVIEDMKNKLEWPSYDEAFDKIYEIEVDIRRGDYDSLAS